MAKTLHTMTKAELLLVKEFVDPSLGAHYIDLPNGRILVVVRFKDEDREMAFHEALPGKVDLPHPVYEGKVTLSPAHVEEVHHLFTEHTTDIERKAAASKATVIDIARRAAQIHPMFRLSLFPNRALS